MRKKSRKIPVNDTQVDNVYAWEAAFDQFNICTLSLAECEKLVLKTLKAAGCKPVAVYQGPSNRYSWCMPVLRRICMQGPSRQGRGGMNVATVLHEVAHQIVYDRYGDKTQDHGPTFMGMYRRLLLDHKIMTEKEFRLTSLKFGLKWARDQ